MNSYRVFVVDFLEDKQFSEFLKLCARYLECEIEFAANVENVVSNLAARMPDILMILRVSNNDDKAIVDVRTTSQLCNIPIFRINGEYIDLFPWKLREHIWWLEEEMTLSIDVEEMKLRFKNLLSDAHRYIDPISRRPKEHLLQTHLERLRRNKKCWTEITVRLEHSGKTDGEHATNNIAYSISCLIGSVLIEFGTKEDFIAHPQQNRFVIITHTENVVSLTSELEKRVAQVVKQHEAPLPSLTIEVQQHD